MKKIIGAFVFLLLTSHQLFSQSSFGVFAEAGASKIKLVGLNEPNFKFDTRYVPSARAGLYYNCIVRDKFIFGTKLLITYGGGKVDYDVHDTSSGCWLFCNVKGTLDLRVFAFGFNPYIGYKYKKFSLNIGMQAHDIFWGSSNNKYIEYSSAGNPNPSEEEYADKQTDAMLAFDYGFTAGISYHINRRFTAETNYYHGLNMYLDGEQTGVIRSRQLTIGVKYSILTSKKKETKQIDK